MVWEDVLEPEAESALTEGCSLGLVGLLVLDWNEADMIKQRCPRHMVIMIHLSEPVETNKT